MNNDDYIPIREVWNFEQNLASKPDVWRNEAINLRFTAEALWLYDDEVIQKVFHDRAPCRLPSFFSARVERMLLGFSLENLVKAVLLQDEKWFNDVFSKEGTLSWGKDGHNLLKLFQQANVETSLMERKYLEAWQLCALWAGRYPLPTKEIHLPRQRKPLPSQEALLKRRVKIMQIAHAENDQLLGAGIHDIIHSGVGSLEREAFIELFKRCDSHFAKEGREI